MLGRVRGECLRGPCCCPLRVGNATLRLAGGAQVIITQDMDLSRTLEAEWALLEAHSEDVHGSSDPQTQPSEAVPWWAYLITALLKPLM